MDLTHLHLLINHVPVMGLAFGLLILVLGLFRKSEELKLGAALIFIISAVMVVPVQQTGEAAEHTVDELTGVSHDRIEEHEDASDFVLPPMILLALASIFGLVRYKKDNALPKFATYSMLVLALFSSTVVARVAYLGGMIRHTEVHGDAPAGEAEDEKEDRSRSNKGRK